MRITDKMRLDWVARGDNRTYVSGYPDRDGFYTFDGSMRAGIWFSTLRQAIDAAIRAERKRKKP